MVAEALTAVAANGRRFQGLIQRVLLVKGRRKERGKGKEKNKKGRSEREKK